MKKVLVVEGDASLRYVLSYLLMVFRHHPDVASDAREALQLLEKNRYDAIVTEYNMPGMDGIELIGAIKERTPRVPVILMTGCLDERVLEFSGADACLHKPFSPRDLRDALDLAFRDADGAAGPP